MSLFKLLRAKMKKRDNFSLLVVIGVALLSAILFGVFLLLTQRTKNENTFVNSRLNPNKVSAYLPDAGIQANIINQSNKTTVSLERGSSSLSFAVPISNATTQNEDTVLKYTADNNLIELEYTLLKNGIKEDIILNQTPLTNTFESDLVLKNLYPAQTDDNQFVFYDSKNNEYQFHFEPPYAIDAAGSKTYAVRYYLQIDDSNNTAPTNETNNVESSLHEEISKQTLNLLQKPTALAEIEDLARNNSQSYKLIVEVDPSWLHDPNRAYPIKIDPTVVHNTSATFAGGQFNRTHDVGSGSSPIIETQIKNPLLDENTVAYWKLNETAGTTLEDSTVNNFDGTANNLTIVDGQELFGKARSFNGTTSHITTPVDAEVDNLFALNTNSWTVSAWFKKPTSSGTVDTVVSRGGGTGTGSTFGIFVDASDNLSTVIRGIITIIQPSVADGNWYHVAVTWDGINAKAYVNGVPKGNLNVGTASLQSYTVTIGTRASVLGDFFNGEIDEIFLSSKALSADEIQVLVKGPKHFEYGTYTSPVIDLGTSMIDSLDTISWAGNGLAASTQETPISATNLVANWTFNQTSGTTLTNTAGSCGGSCNGTLTNFSNTTGPDVVAESGWTTAQRKTGTAALMFDGANDYVEVPNSSNLQLTNDFTLETWIKRGSRTGDFERILSKSDTTNGFDYFMQLLTDGSLRCGVMKATVQSYYITSSRKVPLNDWTHVACSLNASNEWALYINGEKISGVVTGTSGVARTSTAPFHLGRTGNGGVYNYGMNGILDSTRVWNRTLPQSEIISNVVSYRAQLETRSSANGTTWETWRPTGNTATITTLDFPSSSTTGVISANTTSFPRTQGSNSLQINTANATYGNLVAHWTLDETGGTGAYIRDSVGSAHGTPTGTSTTKGYIGQARSFNGSTDTVSIPAAASLDVQNHTISLWVHSSNLSQSSFLFEKTTNGSINTQNSIYLEGNNIRYRTYNAAASVNTLSTVWTSYLKNNAWNNITVVYDGSFKRIYLNGQEATSAAYSQTLATGNGPSSIGTRMSGTWPFNGLIDDVRVYSTNLSATQIQEMYESGSKSHMDISLSTDLSTRNYISYDLAANRPGTYLSSGIFNGTTSDVIESHTITEASTWKVPEGVSEVDVLVIGGGGGGGKAENSNRAGGGGGAGDVVYRQNHKVSPGSTLSMSVGAGGDGSAGSGLTNPEVATMRTGESSTFGSLTAIGGGGGGNGNAGTGANGGSGGGSGRNQVTTRGLTIGELGSNGGFGAPVVGLVEERGGGGGGGAGGAGTDGTNGPSGTGGDGGIGIQNNITGTNVYYAGGGGGARSQGGGGAGGLGGGGAGASSFAGGTPGTANTGGGGGGAATFGTGITNGGDGGSGIVIIRYKPPAASQEITIDFGAKLDAADLITGSGDLSFTVNEQVYNKPQKAGNIQTGETIVIREKIGANTYTAQGAVTTVNPSTGAITVASWDAGSSFPSGGYTVQADVFKWQRVYWDISSLPTDQRSSIDSFKLHVTNDAEGRTVWLDNMVGVSNYFSTSSGSTITSTPQRYLQYRAILTNQVGAASSEINSVSIDYTENLPPDVPTLNSPTNAATGTQLTPTLQTTAVDSNSDYMRYRISVCTDSGMTLNCQTFDQTSSQTGWSGQNAQTSTAYTSGTQGSYTLQSPLQPGTTYYWKSQAIDPGGTNTWGTTQVTPYSFTTNAAPNTPTLDSPADSATGVPPVAVFSTTTTDSNSDYLRYRINLCENAGMSTNCETFDQTSTQTGWSGQNAQTSTAYTSGTQATYTYQGYLTPNTTYYWKSQAIDTGGANTWSAVQVTPYSFTTQPNVVPDIPTGLEVNNTTNPTDIVTLTPTFRATFSDPDIPDTAASYTIQVSTNPSFSPGFAQWSGNYSPQIANGGQSTNVNYSGTPLQLNGQTYYWRIRFTDTHGGVSPWSTETATFSMYDLQDSPTCTVQKANDNSSMTVIWNNVGTGADAFEVERKVNAGSWTNITTEAGTESQYQDTDITNGNSYQYRVRSSYLSVPGEWCVTATLTPDIGNLRFSAF